MTTAHLSALVAHYGYLATFAAILLASAGIPIPAGEMLLTHADLTKTRQILGYSPKVSFEEGIRRFAAWLKSQP